MRGILTQSIILTVLDKVNDSIVVFDRKGNIAYVNKAFADILGLKTSQMIGKNIWELRPRLVESAIYKNVIEAIEKKEVRTVEWSSPYSDKCWETKIFPSEEGVTAIGRDITERKKNEETIKIFSSAFQLATDSIFFVNSTGKILHFNEAAYRQRGYTHEEMAKMNFRELVVPKFLEEAAQRIKDIQAKGEGTFETVDRRKDGSEMPVEVNARIVTINGQRMALCVVRDITERQKTKKH